MLRLFDSMEEGTILKWLKSDGDDVSKGEELVEIETDKANMTYEADSDGVLEIVAQEGDTLSVGETIARLGSGSAGGDSDEGGEESGAEASSDEDEEAEGDAETEDEDEETTAEEDEGAEREGDSDAEAETDGEDQEQEAQAEGDEEPEGEGEGDEAEARDGGDSGNGHRESKPEPAPASAAGGDGDGDGNGRVKASPVARRMAREMGVELATLEGTGPGGRIVKADVEAAARGDGATTEAPEQGEAEPTEKEAEAPAAEKKDEREEEKAPAPVVSSEQGRGDTETVELTRLQRTVARRMAESKATAPDFVITLEVDMDEAVEFRKQLKAAAGDSPAPSFNDFVIKASALALRDFPRANGAYKDGKFELYSRVNVGVAVAGMDALVVPTVFDADRKSLGQIARESRALAERVRAGKITPPELSGGTFTVSNLGMYGIRRFVAVINPPQAAILAVGELAPRAVVRDGEVVIRPVLELTLSCDHRILYGADAAEFLARIREYLETPLKLAF
jgi:pyruvate dehydrogenase E2 component (dihydrolipoamide acetyltransferase)